EANDTRKGRCLRAEEPPAGVATTRGHSQLQPACRGGSRLQRDARKGGGQPPYQGAMATAA
ncbi:hypothetical protein GW17_00055039, partial [Ensete ventricosum]